MAEAFDVVTGGAGFIGGHLVHALLRRGTRVRVVDDFSSGRRSYLSELGAEFGEQLEVREQDIREIDALRELLDGSRVVYHQAAVTSVPRSIRDPLNSNSANVDGTLNVLVAARDVGVAKVVYASSSSVYGDTSVLPKHEKLEANPLSPYAISKYAAEMYAKVFSRVYGLPTYGLRYFNVFGPRQDPHSQYAAVIPLFVTRMLEGKPPIVYGDGEQTRDFTFVENVVSANLLAAECEADGISANIGCGDRFSLNQLIAMLGEILETSVQPVFEEARTGDVRDSQADIGLARATMGYQPEVGFAEGLRRTVEWYRSRRV